MVFANAENNFPLIDALNVKHLILKCFSFIPIFILENKRKR